MNELREHTLRDLIAELDTARAANGLAGALALLDGFAKGVAEECARIAEADGADDVARHIRQEAA